MNLIKYAVGMLGSSAMYDVAPLLTRRPIGPGVRQFGNPRSRYMRNQGAREIARRQRQAARLA